MADVTINLQNIFAAPSAPPTVMTVDADAMLNVGQETSSTLKKRAGDIVVGDNVCHAGGSFVVVV